MPAGDIIIIGPGPKVKTNLSVGETVARLRYAADALESGQLDVEPAEETE